MLLFHIWNLNYFFFFFKRGAHVGMRAHTHTQTHIMLISNSNNSNCFSSWIGNRGSVLTRQIFLKMCKWKQQPCEPGPSFRLGWVSELTLQSPVTFNYHCDSASWTASQSARLPAWSNLEPQQNRADLETKALTFWEIAAARQSGVCTNCLSWPRIVGPVIFSTFPTRLISSGQCLSQ